MKRKLLIISTLSLSLLVGCGNTNPSSEINSSSSSEFIDNRTAKEKVLDVCNYIIENREENTLVSSTQTLNGDITLTNLDSVTSIYYSNKLSFSDFSLISTNEYIEEDNLNNSLYQIIGEVNYLNYLLQYIH